MLLRKHIVGFLKNDIINHAAGKVVKSVCPEVGFRLPHKGAWLVNLKHVILKRFTAMQNKFNILISMISGVVDLGQGVNCGATAALLHALLFFPSRSDSYFTHSLSHLIDLV